MDNNDAKLILQVCRPGGEDASDPFFAEALEQARLDPALRIWFAEQQAKDERMRGALQIIVPPHDLRDMIVRTQKIAQFPSGASRRKTQFVTLLAIAACILFLLVAGGLIRLGMDRNEDHASTFAAVTQQILDLKRHDRVSLGEMSSDPAKLRSWLAERGAPSDFKVPPGLRGIPSLGCQTYDLNGVKVSLVCFALGPDQFVHVFVMDRDAIKDAPTDATPSVRTDGGVAVVTWSAGDKSYVLVGNNVNEDILRRLFGAA